MEVCQRKVTPGNRVRDVVVAGHPLEMWLPLELGGHFPKTLEQQVHPFVGALTFKQGCMSRLVVDEADPLVWQQLREAGCHDHLSVDLQKVDESLPSGDPQQKLLWKGAMSIKDVFPQARHKAPAVGETAVSQFPGLIGGHLVLTLLVKGVGVECGRAGLCRCQREPLWFCRADNVDHGSEGSCQWRCDGILISFGAIIF